MNLLTDKSIWNYHTIDILIQEEYFSKTDNELFKNYDMIIQGSYSKDKYPQKMSELKESDGLVWIQFVTHAQVRDCQIGWFWIDQYSPQMYVQNS